MSPAAGRPRWGRIAGAVAVVVLLVAVVVVLLAGGSSGSAPPAQATRLVPAGALAYVHLSTDTGRGATRRARDLVGAFPSYDLVRAAILARVSAPQCGLDASSVKGREAALAIVPGTGTTAGSLLLVDSGKDAAGVRTRACGALTVTSIGRFVAVGQPAVLQQARDLARGDGASLGDEADFKAATADLPADRALDGWASVTGVRRLLSPQSGVLGAAGVLLDRPGLRGAAFGVGAEQDGARLSVVSELEPGTKQQRFAPKLTPDVPASALAYLGAAGVSASAERLLGASGAATGQVGELLGRAATALGRQTGGALQRDVLSLLQGEVAISLSPQGTGTVLTLQAPTSDEAATRSTLRRLEPSLAKLLAGSTGAAPTWTASGAVRRLVVTQGVELDYEVVSGRLIVATQPGGIAAARAAGDGLPSTDGYRATVGDPGKAVTSLGFLDFGQVLRLAERSGLNDNQAYQAVRADLERISAVGLVVTADGNHTTAELHLSIP